MTNQLRTLGTKLSLAISQLKLAERGYFVRMFSGFVEHIDADAQTDSQTDSQKDSQTDSARDAEQDAEGAGDAATPGLDGSMDGLDASLVFSGAWELSLRLGHILKRANLMLEVAKKVRAEVDHI